MDNHPKSRSRLVLRLVVGLALLGWPRAGEAQGTWSVLSLPQQPGPLKPDQVVRPTALAVDAAGNLYVADNDYLGGTRHDRIQKRNPQGNWSLIATFGAFALAVDPTGNLYVAEYGIGPIQKRDPQGTWSVIANFGTALGQGSDVLALAADGAGNLYVADDGINDGRIQKRDAQGNWSVFAGYGWALGQIYGLTGLAADAAGNLYVADDDDINISRIQKRDVQGNWSLIASYDGQGLGQVTNPTPLATDIAGNLYVVDSLYNNGYWEGWIQKRDVQGNWSVFATVGWDVGQAYGYGITALAVDGADNLYIAETWRNTDYDEPRGQIRKRDAQGNWSVIATAGDGLGQVYRLTGLAVDAAGNLYVADTYNHRVQRLTPRP